MSECVCVCVCVDVLHAAKIDKSETIYVPDAEHVSPSADMQNPICVDITADVARLPDASALPALNPNQPHHSNPVPVAASGMLDGGNLPCLVRWKKRAYKQVCVCVCVCVCENMTH